MKKVMIEYASATHGTIRITGNSPTLLGIHTDLEFTVKSVTETADWLLHVYITEDKYLSAAPLHFVNEYKRVIGSSLRKELSDLSEF